MVRPIVREPLVTRAVQRLNARDGVNEIISTHRCRVEHDHRTTHDRIDLNPVDTIQTFERDPDVTHQSGSLRTMRAPHFDVSTPTIDGDRTPAAAGDHQHCPTTQGPPAPAVQDSSLGASASESRASLR